MIRLYRLWQGERRELFGAPSLLLVEQYVIKVRNRRGCWIEAEGGPATHKPRGPKPKQRALF